MVVKATDDRLRCDATYVLDSARDGSVFAKRLMSSSARYNKRRDALCYVAGVTVR